MSTTPYSKNLLQPLVVQKLYLLYNEAIMPQENDDIDFSKLCLSIRAKKGWTQQQMADFLKTHLRSYQRWEYGDGKPHADAAYKLAQLDFSFQLEQILKERFNPS